jgi:hypothetical protein
MLGGGFDAEQAGQPILLRLDIADGDSVAACLVMERAPGVAKHTNRLWAGRILKFRTCVLVVSQVKFESTIQVSLTTYREPHFLSFLMVTSPKRETEVLLLSRRYGCGRGRIALGIGRSCSLRMARARATF